MRCAFHDAPKRWNRYTSAVCPQRHLRGPERLVGEASAQTLKASRRRLKTDSPIPDQLGCPGRTQLCVRLPRRSAEGKAKVGSVGTGWDSTCAVLASLESVVWLTNGTGDGKG